MDDRRHAVPPPAGGPAARKPARVGGITRLAAVALLGLMPALVGCTSTSIASASPAVSATSLRGIVVARPCTGGPEPAQGTPCPGVAVGSARVVFAPASGSPVTVATSADGTFTAPLAPGRYDVSIEAAGLYQSPQTTTLEVPVAASELDSFGRLRLVIDSGLR